MGGLTYQNAETLSAEYNGEPGYVKAAKRRGFTAVRLPWVKKPVVPVRRVDGSGVLPENRENF